jgi:hypothetical protein
MTSMTSMTSIQSITRLAFAVLVSACSKPSAPAGSDAAVPAASTPVSSASPQAAIPSAAASATAGHIAAASFSGTYKTKPGTLYIPTEGEFAKVKQAPDDGSRVGEGTFSLDVDESGKALGSVDTGPLAPATISGTVSGGTITGTIRRKDPTDEGLTGSFSATTAGGKLDGKMELANANASILREATISANAK